MFRATKIVPPPQRIDIKFRIFKSKFSDYGFISDPQNIFLKHIIGSWSTDDKFVFICCKCTVCKPNEPYQRLRFEIKTNIFEKSVNFLFFVLLFGLQSKKLNAFLQEFNKFYINKKKEKNQQTINCLKDCQSAQFVNSFFFFFFK